MTAGHAYELPTGVAGLDEAVDDAARGQVVYLARHGERVAAVVPIDVASAGIEAREDAEALAASRAALAEGGFTPAEDVHAELGL